MTVSPLAGVISIKRDRYGKVSRAFPVSCPCTLVIAWGETGPARYRKGFLFF